MDPLDQRLAAAGEAWRRSQPEPADLDRLVGALERRGSGVLPRRLVSLLVAGFLLAAAIAVAPGVGGFLGRFTTGLPPAASASPGPGPSEVAATPGISAEPADAVRAHDLLDGYERALIAGEWQKAFDMLSPTSPTRAAGVEAYRAERAAYFASVAGRFVIADPSPVSDWTPYEPLLVRSADLSRASLVEVDYPAMSDNNAGFEQFVVAPDASGSWWIWPVR